MAKEKKVVRHISNLGDLSMFEIENAIEYLLFVDNEEKFPMSEYTNIQPIITDLAKLMVVYADVAARKVQDDLTRNIAIHLKDEVAKVIYDAKKPTIETLTITEAEVEPHNDW